MFVCGHHVGDLADQLMVLNPSDNWGISFFMCKVVIFFVLLSLACSIFISKIIGDIKNIHCSSFWFPVSIIANTWLPHWQGHYSPFSFHWSPYVAVACFGQDVLSNWKIVTLFSPKTGCNLYRNPLLVLSDFHSVSHLSDAWLSLSNLCQLLTPWT